MQQKDARKTRVEFIRGKWVAHLSRGVPMDSLVMDVSNYGTNYAAGFIVASHGIPQEVSRTLDMPTQRQLGVGAQLRPSGAPRVGTTRMNLNPDGTITRN